MWYEIDGFQRYLVSDDGKVLSKAQKWWVGNSIKRRKAALIRKLATGKFCLRAGPSCAYARQMTWEQLWELRGDVGDPSVQYSFGPME